MWISQRIFFQGEKVEKGDLYIEMQIKPTSQYILNMLTKAIKVY